VSTSADLQGVQDLGGVVSATVSILANLTGLQELAGTADGFASTLANLIRVRELAGTIDGVSDVEADLKVATVLLDATVDSVSSLVSDLTVSIPPIELIGSVDSVSLIEGALSRVEAALMGVASCVSSTLGDLYEIPIGFYEASTNSITTYFEDYVVTPNSLVARYSNDPTETPTEDLWCDADVEFGATNIIATGRQSMRVVGSFNIEVHTPLGIGIADGLEISDIIASGFRTTIVDSNIKFKTPSVKRLGRVGDNYDFRVACPFSIDREYVRN